MEYDHFQTIKMLQHLTYSRLLGRAGTAKCSSGRAAHGTGPIVRPLGLHWLPTFPGNGLSDPSPVAALLAASPGQRTDADGQGRDPCHWPALNSTETAGTMLREVQC